MCGIVGQGASAALDHCPVGCRVLSDAAQPMANEDGTLWVTFNGEIYNHAEIRAELENGEGHRWKADHSDTEVILHAFEQWGHRLRRDQEQERPVNEEALYPNSVVEADGIGAGIRESAFRPLSRKGAMGMGRHIRRRIATFVALLVYLFPWVGSASQVSAPAPGASSGSQSRGTTPASAIPFARCVDSPTIFPFMASRYEAAREAIIGY